MTAAQLDKFVSAALDALGDLAEAVAPLAATHGSVLANIQAHAPSFAEGQRLLRAYLHVAENCSSPEEDAEEMEVR